MERYCGLGLRYFPLFFVYGLTSWAVWVESAIGFLPKRPSWTGPFTSVIGIILYLLLNWSYTTAVFVDPGSPSQSAGYSHLPTHNPPSASDSALTVKSTGSPRFCKKCQSRKPDRVHHCSTCRRCVLKMDHHCPWLATCVGLRNYKPFLLFLIYTTLFCGLDFAVAASWVYHELQVEGEYTESLTPINNVMLAVIAGIIGIVLAGFTSWHLSLAFRNATTIECLEKTRYLSPLRQEMRRQPPPNPHPGTQTYGQQLLDIHTNALPGITRPEEGEERLSPLENTAIPPPSSSSSPAQTSLQRNYSELERSRDRLRYEAYLDEQVSAALPNAFDLGWRRNLAHLFGPTPLLWLLPVCNTTGDGWNWEVSPKWVRKREEVRRERERESDYQRGGRPGAEQQPAGQERHYLAASRAPSSRADGGGAMSMTTLLASEDGDAYDTPSDDDDDDDDEAGTGQHGDQTKRTLLRKQHRTAPERQDPRAGAGVAAQWRAGDDW